MNDEGEEGASVSAPKVERIGARPAETAESQMQRHRRLAQRARQSQAEEIQSYCRAFGVDYSRLGKIVGALNLKPSRNIFAGSNAHERRILDIQKGIIGIARIKIDNERGMHESRREISYHARKLIESLKNVSGLDENFMSLLNHLSSVDEGGNPRRWTKETDTFNNYLRSRIIDLWIDVTIPGQRGRNAFVKDTCEALSINVPSTKALDDAFKRARGVKKEKRYSPKKGGGKY
ncbi:hypothetical protein [Methylocystis bryophila]|uniref:Uncharacterized protein n=1 Tax=Methylocystis bryophila TaxID=655015 RepID=A0A1W6MT75_9HYPH|nr:hypothetical protein [Methylocystis bryophila]ARN80689.1 hypothetical protein B1812_05930 [Methylocystis bryophila]BDV40755.1 hypothetical protein DSM21852_40080 [Methylocystis bryophila]